MIRPLDCPRKLIQRKPLKHATISSKVVRIRAGMVRHLNGPVRGDLVFIEKDLLESVGFLYEGFASSTRAKREQVGTCFFITVWNFARDAGFGYIVTAKHVVEHIPGKLRPTMFVRLNKHTIEPGTTGVKYFLLPNDWQFHQDPAVDLAVLPWGTVKNNFVCSSLSYEHIVATPDFWRTHGGAWPPGIGEPLVFIGMMSQVSGVARNYPIARHGHLALVTDEKITGEYGPSEYYIADLQTYPGHSGGPVWVLNDRTMFLLGVMAAGYQQPLIVSAGQKRKVEKYNLGVSLVVPMEKLTEIMSSKTLVDRRKRDTPRPVKPVPVA